MSPFQLKCWRVYAPTNVVHPCRTCWWSRWKTPFLVTNKSYFFRLPFCNLDLFRVRLPQLSSISILVSHSCSKLVSKAEFNSMTERYLAFRNAKDELEIILQAWTAKKRVVLECHNWSLLSHPPHAQCLVGLLLVIIGVLSFSVFCLFALYSNALVLANRL